jgi:hypothetical protein
MMPEPHKFSYAPVGSQERLDKITAEVKALLRDVAEGPPVMDQELSILRKTLQRIADQMPPTLQSSAETLTLNEVVVPPYDRVKLTVTGSLAEYLPPMEVVVAYKPSVVSMEDKIRSIAKQMDKFYQDYRGIVLNSGDLEVIRNKMIEMFAGIPDIPHVIYAEPMNVRFDFSRGSVHVSLHGGCLDAYSVPMVQGYDAILGTWAFLYHDGKAGKYAFNEAGRSRYYPFNTDSSGKRPLNPLQASQPDCKKSEDLCVEITRAARLVASCGVELRVPSIYQDGHQPLILPEDVASFKEDRDAWYARLENVTKERFLDFRSWYTVECRECRHTQDGKTCGRFTGEPCNYAREFMPGFTDYCLLHRKSQFPSIANTPT